MQKILGFAGTAVVTAIGSAVCCAGPVVAASIGVSAAGLSNLTPYRPLFVLAAVGALWVGFDRIDHEKRACDSGQPCAHPAARRRMQRVMRVAFVLVMLFGTAPTWIRWVL